MSMEAVAKNFPPALLKLPAFLLWKEVPQGAGKKPKKLPYYADGAPRHGDLDSPADRSRLVTFEKAAKAYNSSYAGIGIALGEVPGEEIIVAGIDLDGIDYQTDPRAQSIMSEAMSYAEISPNGKGLHILGIVKEQGTGYNSRSGLEYYTNGRFFTVTGKAINNASLADISDAIRLAQSLFPPATQRTTEQRTTGTGKIQEGGRHYEAVKRAAQLASRCKSEGELRGALNGWSETECAEPLPFEEIASIARHAWNRISAAPLKPPRDVPIHPDWNPNDPFKEIPSTLSFIKMSEVRPEKIIPVWPGVLYKGKVTLIAGVPGDGKSLMSCDIAARATVGGPLPCGAGHFDKMRVAFITAEDDPGDTIRPRLDMAGANVDDVLLIRGKYNTDKDGVRHLDQIELLEDIALLEPMIQDQQIKLLIIDPLTSFSSGDTNKTQESRRLLDAVAQMAARQGLSVLVITHMNKRGDAKTAMQLVAGSHVLIAAVRIALAMARDPNDAARRLLLGLKVNIDAETGGHAFRVDVKEHDEVGEVPVIVWEEQRVTNMTAQDVLIDSTPKAQANVEKTMEIQEWLKARLANGALQAVQLFEEAEDKGYTIPRVRLALKHMGAWWERRAFKGPVYWSLSKKK